MRVDLEEVPEESRFLLEIDFQQIRHERTKKQSYWVHAIRAAVKAGRCAKRYKHRQKANAVSARSSLKSRSRHRLITLELWIYEGTRERWRTWHIRKGNDRQLARGQWQIAPTSVGNRTNSRVVMSKKCTLLSTCCDFTLINHLPALSAEE
jgi:hypothetical protein